MTEKSDAVGHDPLARWCRHPAALWRGTAGRVLVTLPDGEPHLLEGTAAVTWELLDRPKTLDELVDQLLRLYDAEETRVREDVTGLLASLAEAGVVKVKSAGGTRPR